jgi:hypothetical protein
VAEIVKRCPKCAESKSASPEHFHLDNRTPTGLSSWCRKCQGAARDAWGKKNRDRVNANAKALRKKQPEKNRESHRKWRGKEGNREKQAAADAARYQANKVAMDARLQRWRDKNRDRVNAISKRSRGRNPDSVKSTKLKASHGITLEIYNAMLATQGGVCAICKESPGRVALAVDHDHATKKLRALLCGRCNTGLGMFRDDPVRLQAAISYLTAHGWIRS